MRGEGACVRGRQGGEGREGRGEGREGRSEERQSCQGWEQTWSIIQPHRPPSTAIVTPQPLKHHPAPDPSASSTPPQW